MKWLLLCAVVVFYIVSIKSFLIKPLSICSSQNGLSAKQKTLCHQFRKHMEYMVDGGRIATDECQRQFKDSRWNCTFPNKQSKGLLTPEMPVGSREAAFTHAIVAAGTMHAISRACMETKLPSSCQCSAESRPNSLDSKYIWGGCGDNLPYGYSFSKKFVDAKEELGQEDMSNIGRVLMNLHNNEAGRVAVIKKSRIQCRCHGLSKGCAVKTCYRQLAEFKEISNYLRERYESGIEVTVAEKVNSALGDGNMELKLQEKHRQFKSVDREDLVYVDDSPDYCLKNEALGSQGTEGRICRKNSKDLNGCKLLCCGRGHHTQRQLLRDKCGCQFIWCCYVKCKTCEKEQNVHFCK